MFEQFIFCFNSVFNTLKSCNQEEYWGLGYDFDPQRLLTPAQKELQATLIELCATVIRPQAIESDRQLTYPRKSFAALASLGLLGLFIPKEWGGLGENHVCAEKTRWSFILLDPTYNA